MRFRLTSAALACCLAACTPTAGENAPTTAEDDTVIRVTGELRSSNSVFFGPPPVGDIWRFTVAFMTPDGAPVKTGQPVLKFNTNELDDRLREKTNYRNEKAKELQKQQIVTKETLADLRLALEEAEAERDKAVLKADIPEDLLARRDYMENQLNLEMARINVSLREAELRKEARLRETEEEILTREIAVLDADIAELERSIKSMTVVAPRDGFAIHVASRHNSKTSVGDEVWRGRRVIEIPDLDRLAVYLEIPERESARVEVGQKVGFSLDAVPEKSFQGTITQLASVVRTKSRNQPARVFDAIVELENADPELMRPGMSVTAEIEALPGVTGS